VSDRVSLPRSSRASHRALLEFSAAADAAAVEAGVGPRLVELVKVRVSQLNGCAFCLRTHTREALAAGETTDRLAVLSAWRETGYFSVEERAALAITEDVTRIADRVLDERAYAAALETLGADRLAAVSWIAIALSALTRVAIASRYDVSPPAE
jgi:AhpD family alkylhydroperoxidase